MSMTSFFIGTKMKRINIFFILGAFIIPFMVMLFIVGTPLLLLELALGQRLRVGAAAAWPKVNIYIK